MKPAIVVVCCLITACISGFAGYLISQHLVNSEVVSEPDVKNSTIRENVKLIYGLLRDNVDWNSFKLNVTELETMTSNVPAHVGLQQVGLKYAQSLFSKLDNVFKNSVENGSDVKLTITNENLPLPLDITIKKGYVKIAKRLLAEANVKIEEFESILSERARRDNTFNETLEPAIVDSNETAANATSNIPDLNNDRKSFD